MASTDAMKGDKVQLLLKLLIVIGGINWGFTAYNLRPTDEIRDVIFILHTKLGLGNTIPIKLQDMQRGVYASVTMASLAWFAMSMQSQ